MRNVLVILIALYSTICFSQNFQSARSAGMGNVSLFLGEVESLFGNHAGLANLDKTSFLLLSEQRFLLKELSGVGLGVAVPTKSGTFGLSMNRYGFSEFKQQSIGISYARLLASNFSLSAQINYREIKIPEYGSGSTLNFEIGLATTIWEVLDLGILLRNPYQREGSDLNFETSFVVSGMYHLSEQVRFALELIEEGNFEMRTAIGIEYEPLERFSVRTGFKTNPASFYLGFSVYVAEVFNLQFANSYDPTLGHTPSAGISYRLK